jgi:hypothetical protein
MRRPTALTSATATAAILFAAPALAQDASAPAAPSTPGVPARVEPLPAGQTKVLQAVVMEVKGAAEWRADDKAAWKAADIDDLLEPGAQIRTGRSSSLALRVGHNSTVLVSALTRIDLPSMVQDGAVLRTRAGVVRGRADFKVDQVGLTNDFEVITPSTTLAVRGTGFGILWGALEGASVDTLPGNTIASIELRYFGSRLTQYLAGRSISSQKHQNPVLAALFNTLGPPLLLGQIIEAIEQALTSGAIPLQALLDQIAISVSEQSSQAVQQFVIDLQGPLLGDHVIIQLVTFVCENPQGFSDLFHSELVNFELVDPKGFDKNFNTFLFNLEALCGNIQGGMPPPGSEAFLQILGLIQTYCNTLGQNFDPCMAAAGTALNTLLVAGMATPTN